MSIFCIAPSSFIVSARMEELRNYKRPTIYHLDDLSTEWSYPHSEFMLNITGSGNSKVIMQNDYIGDDTEHFGELKQQVMSRYF